MGKVDPGKRFEGKLSESLKASGVHVMRIPDKLYWTGKRLASGKTPADFIASYAQMYDGVLHQFLIEAKACSGHRLPYDKLQEHQHDALADYERIHENSHGLVAVNFYDPVSIARMDVCFMVPIDVWDEHAAGSMKSISHEECLEDDRITLCQKAAGGIYDMTRWLGGYDGA